MKSAASSNGDNVFPSQHTVRRMEIEAQFSQLSDKQRLYAHYMSRAAWSGARIIFEQVSPESSIIFDLIIELFHSCGGDWNCLLERLTANDPGHWKQNEAEEQLLGFREYAAKFLANLGNYYGSGDQKFVPTVTKEFLTVLAAVSSTRATELLERCVDAMLSPTPGSLGYPSELAQSQYYPNWKFPIAREELAFVGNVMQRHGIGQENTRVVKVQQNDNGSGDVAMSYEVLLASVEQDSEPMILHKESPQIMLVRGDYTKTLSKICDYLVDARKYCENKLQEGYIDAYINHFRTGDLELHKESQRLWVKDHKPPVEMMFGFVEPYRDPYGTRAEFEGIVAVVDRDATRELTELVNASEMFIPLFPWVEGAQGAGGRNGPFEKDLPELPDFTAIHALAYCSSIIFLGINLPNYDDVRQTCGFKNVMIVNRNRPWSGPSPTFSPQREAPFIDPSEVERYLKHRYHAHNLHITIHELLGHGTGKLLAEQADGTFNFDIANPPISPLTGKPVSTWYKPRETWTSVFGNLATSMEECRAESVGSYLITAPRLLRIFGFTKESEVTGNDIIYNDYLDLGVNGLRALESYIVEDKKWGQAHARGHFAMLRTLLSSTFEGNNYKFMTIDVNYVEKKLTVRIDRSKILTHGRRAIEDLLLRLHIYRCTADVENGRAWYESLTEVDEHWLKVREIVLANSTPPVLLLQGNTVLEECASGARVMLKEYEPTVDGMIRSWAEREV